MFVGQVILLQQMETVFNAKLDVFGHVIPKIYLNVEKLHSHYPNFIFINIHYKDRDVLNMMVTAYMLCSIILLQIIVIAL